MDLIKTQNKKFICPECQNENTVADDKKVGEVIECSYCGMEYEIMNLDNGEFSLQLIEEEK